MRKHDLEERLIDFAVGVIKMTNKMTDTYANKYFAQQLIRSGSSPALNYGEAQSGESMRDFIHKMKIVLKELRESYNNLRIIKRAGLSVETVLLDKLITECNELISIFVKSIQTASGNSKMNNR